MTSKRPREIVIGLDVGTTATKAVAFDLESSWRASASIEYPLLEPRPGWQVQQPDAVATAVRDAVGQCVTAAEGARVLAISLSAAWHGLIGLDATNHPVTPIITWADARATQTLLDLRAEQDVSWLHQISGTPVHPMSPVLKLRWFQQHEPALASGVRWWIGVKDFVILTLTGVVATELSTASGTGLLNRWTQTWSPQAAEVACVDMDALPPVHPPSTSVALQASFADEVGLPEGTPVILGAADGPLGNVGTGAIDAGVAGLSLGTSGAVRLLVSEQPANLDPSLFCYSLDERTWALGGAISNGGLVARWLGETFADGELPLSDREVLDIAGTVTAGSEGLVMLPFLIAERAPLWDPTIPGAYLGVARRHRRAHFVRAAIEGVALQLATIADRLARVQPIHAVRATGGAFAGPLWGEVVAGMLGREVVICGAGSGTALGAAAFGLRALDLAPDLSTARAMLVGAELAHDEVVVPESSLVQTYAAVRTQVSGLLDALAPMARALAPTQ